MIYATHTARHVYSFDPVAFAMNVDPLAHKFPWQSPYSVFDNSPIWKNDPTGAAASPSTEVTDNGSYYTVVNGKADGDRNIYVVGSDGNRTGAIIGKSLTEYSFLSDKGEAVKGAIIKPNDNSGENFLNNEIIGSNLNVMRYISHATGGQTYDFKTRGMGKNLDKIHQDQYKYRGMPVNGVIGLGNTGGGKVYASGRDIGNVGAGIVAGNNGLSWGAARLGFDALQSYQRHGFDTEGQPTQQAERVGHEIGIKLYNDDYIKDLWKESISPAVGPKY
jgi:hypothetical protein